MPKTLKQKKIKFSIEFEMPPRDEVVERTPCSFCKAPVGKPCSTPEWGGAWSGGKRGGNKMSNLHHDRYATYMGLQVVYPGTLYRIKG